MRYNKRKKKSNLTNKHDNEYRLQYAQYLSFIYISEGGVVLNLKKMSLKVTKCCHLPIQKINIFKKPHLLAMTFKIFTKSQKF